MASIVWPPSLPSPLLSQILERTPDLTLRSSVDRGPAKLRLRTLAEVTEFSIGLLLTRAQAATFDTFYRTTTAGGTLPFEWTHPRTGNLIDFRFVGAPQLRQLAPRQSNQLEMVRVDFTLEALPGTEVEVAPPPPPPPPPDPTGGGDIGYALLLVDPFPDEAPTEGDEGFFALPPYEAVSVPSFLYDTLTIDGGDGSTPSEDDTSFSELLTSGSSSPSIDLPPAVDLFDLSGPPIVIDITP